MKSRKRVLTGADTRRITPDTSHVHSGFNERLITEVDHLKSQTCYQTELAKIEGLMQGGKSVFTALGRDKSLA